MTLLRHFIHRLAGSILASGVRPVRARSGMFMLLTVLAVSLCLGQFPQTVSHAGQKVSEYELKAVYLYNFLQFVQWPVRQKNGPKDNARIIGVIGDSPFEAALTELQISVNKSATNPVRVIYYGRYRDELNLSTCHLLFVCESEKKHLNKIIAGVRGTPVLTVSDMDGFISSGGMIALVREKGKIRWMINRGMTDRAGLRLSSQLLNIAAGVVEQP